MRHSGFGKTSRVAILKSSGKEAPCKLTSSRAYGQGKTVVTIAIAIIVIVTGIVAVIAVARHCTSPTSPPVTRRPSLRCDAMRCDAIADPVLADRSIVKAGWNATSVSVTFITLLIWPSRWRANSQTLFANRQSQIPQTSSARW